MGVRIPNTDGHPREDIRTRSGPNSEIFDEFAREITMKASLVLLYSLREVRRRCCRSSATGGRKNERERGERGRGGERRPLNSAAATPSEHANIDFRCITTGVIGIRMWRTFSDGTSTRNSVPLYLTCRAWRAMKKIYSSRL